MIEKRIERKVDFTKYRDVYPMNDGTWLNVATVTGFSDGMDYVFHILKHDQIEQAVEVLQQAFDDWFAEADDIAETMFMTLCDRLRDRGIAYEAYVISEKFNGVDAAYFN